MFEHSHRIYKFVLLFVISLLKSSLYFLTELSKKKKLNIKMLTLITLIVINSSCSLVVFVLWKLNFVISQLKYNKQITSMVGSFAQFLCIRCEEPLTQSLLPRSIVRTHLTWYPYIFRWICLSYYLCLYPYTWNATVDWVMKKTYHRTNYIREHYT